MTTHDSMNEDVRQWTTKDVGRWLEKLNLQGYLTAFEDNNIDGEALLLMDEPALRDIGIASIGHRVVLLDEIYLLKVAHKIPLEPGDWVPQGMSGEAVRLTHTQLRTPKSVDGTR